jgi:UMF1 family MFS transporter
VFYNSYLPDLAAPAERDKLSAQGFAYGYVGSVILLVLSLLPILKPAWFGGISSGLASRFSFLATGIWWFGFAHITFARMPKDVRTKAGSIAAGIKRGISTTIATGRHILNNESLVRYLPAFFFYNMGVQTIMALATLFGSAELHMDSGALITTILLLQIVAIFGAMLTARCSKHFGNKPVLLLLIVVWIGVCITAYYVQTPGQFQCLAAVVGLMMGGIQSLSRSTWSKLLPPEEEHKQASYFSFMDVVDRLSIVFGTFAFGFVQQLTGSMRMSALVLCLFFVLGGLLLLRLRVTKAIAPYSLAQ